MQWKFKRKISMEPTQIIVLGFAMTILLGGILLNLPVASQKNQSVGFLNAIFTATSAVCVTGLSVVDTGTYWSVFGKVVIITLIQIGGIGFMSMATLFYFVIGKKISLKERLVIQESLNQYDLSGLVRLTRNMLIGTFLIEGIGAFLLSFRFIPEKGFAVGVAYSLFHSISAFCNAGFDIIGNGRSLTPYQDSILVNFVIMGLIVSGGMGFTVILDFISKRSFKRLNLHSKIVIFMTSFLIIFGAIVFFALEYDNPKTLADLSLKGKVLGALFQSVSPRTAGFNTIDIVGLKDASKFFTIILMFIGGSPASTAGGIKTVTFAVIMFGIIATIKGKEDVEGFGRRISYRAVNKAIAVIGIASGLVITCCMILTLTEKFDFLSLLFETVSAFGTVGLTSGVTPGLTIIGKIVVIFLMFSGRVGVLTILLALAKKENKTLIKYPEGKVIVG